MGFNGVMVVDELLLHRVPPAVNHHVHVAPALARDGAHAVEAPPSGLLAEAGGAAVGLVSCRQVGDIGIDGHIDGGSHIVQSEPAQCAHLVGQVGAALDDGAIHGEMHGNIALAQFIPAAVDAEEVQLVALHEGVGHGGDDLLAILVSHGQRLAHVVGCAFVVVFEHGHHLLDGHQRVGFHGEGVVFGVGVEVQRRSQQVEHAPLTTAAGNHGACAGCVGVGELESGFAVPPAVLLGQRIDVVGGHEVVFVLEVYFAYGRGIGIDGHMVVGHALSRPHGTHLAFAGAEDFEVPHFILVGNGKALAGIVPAVAFQQVSCHADGFARGGAALHHQHAQTLAVDEAAVGFQLCTSAEGRFADGQLFLIHAWVGGVQELVSMCYLVYFSHAHILVAGHLTGLLFGPLPFVERLFLACTMVAGGFHQDVGARAVTVVGVRGHHGTVSRGPFANRDGGALHPLRDGVDFILREAGKCYK